MSDVLLKTSSVNWNKNLINLFKSNEQFIVENDNQIEMNEILIKVNNEIEKISLTNSQQIIRKILLFILPIAAIYFSYVLIKILLDPLLNQIPKQTIILIFFPTILIIITSIYFTNKLFITKKPIVKVENNKIIISKMKY
ncbi:MAG: hypothetical protein IPH62_00135 [Ignavibacteriae bacterium]|nr:hypothetical protein [Ignavibacteriota bacterium]